MSAPTLQLPPPVLPCDMRSQEFKVIHEKLCLDVNMEEQSITGYADLIVVPFVEKLKHIYISCKHAVQSVTLDGLPCRYEFQSLATSAARPGARPSQVLGMDHVRSATAFELQTMEAMDIQEQGELKIWVPEAKQRAQKVAVDASASPDAAAPAAASSAAASEMEAEPLILRIAYTLHARDLTAGMHFLKATPYAPNRASQLVTTSSIACGVEPSLWCPCVDQFDERHTWEMEIAAPIEYVVVASGTLQHKRVIAGGKLLWSFKVDTPVQARAVGLAVGPFVGEVPEEFATARGDPPIKWYSVPARPAGLSKVVESRAAPLAPSIAAAAASSPHAATLSLLRHTLAQHLPAMITLYETLFGSAYPFGAFKVLFLEEVHSSDIGFANFVVLDRDLLYDGTIIDAVYSSTGAIAYAIALNWVSCSLWLESTADWWIVQGIAGWAAGMFVAQVFGTNEMKWRSLQSAAFVMDEDAEQAACYQRDADDGADEGSRRLYDAHPLYWPGFLLFTDLENPVMRAKAQVVFRMLDQRVGGGAAASGQGLKSLVLRIMDEFTAGGSGGGGDDAAPDDANLTARLSTIRLLEICIDLAGQASGVASLKTAGESDNLLMAEHGEPLRAFFEQWILCTGYPALKVDFAYSAKRKVSTVQIEQSPEAAIGAAPGGPLVRFSGALKFRVHEADRINDQERHIPASMTAGPAGATAPGGAAFTQVAPNRIEFEFICSSKVRRNRKRRKMDESSLAALPLDKLLVRHNDTPILYCRVDPLCSWFAPLRTGQPDIHLLWKLLHERELVGQWEGVAAVQAAWRDHAAETRVGEMSAAAAARDATQGVSDEKLPDDIYPKTLWSTFRNEQAFVHIRLFAAKCLAESACASWSHGSQAAAAATSLANLKYVHLLLDWFKKEYYENYESNVHLLSQGMSAEAAEADEKRASTVQLRTNSFGSVQEYMMKQLLPIILSKVRLAGSAPSTGSGTGRTATPGDVTRFVLGLLRDNDNSDNLYSDAFYLGSLLDALGNVRLAQQYDPIEPIQNELVRFLNYDQVVPSYRHHLTQRALMASAKLERTKQFARVIAANETAVAYDHYAGPTHDRAVRLAAFKSLIMVLPTKMHLLRKIIDIIEREIMPGASSEMLLHWAWQVAHGNCPARLFRAATEENASFMNRLWRIITLSLDLRTRDAAYRLYRLLWGRDTPSCASDSQRHAGVQLDGYFKSRRATTQERAWSRIARATEYVQSLREPREFTVPTYRNNSSHNRGKAKRQKIAHAAAGHAEHAEDEEAEPIDY